MASTDMAGWNGTVTAVIGAGTTFNCTVTGWSAQINMDSATYSTWADNWKRSFAGTAQMSGTITGVLKYDAAATAPAPIATPLVWGGSIQVVLTAFTGCTWTATKCVIKRVQIGRPDPNGVSQYSLDFESSEGITQAWDET